MIANARMYSVTPQVALQWRHLLEAVIGRAGASTVEIVDHAPPAPISELWQRPDKAAVFMCGLPYSLATPSPRLVAAPVPLPSGYRGRPCYWTDLVVRADSPFETLEQTFGHRLALTTPESQSGFAAPLHHLMAQGRSTPLYCELIEPRFTPMGALTAVIENRVEIAPLDSYALALLSRHAPDLTAKVRIVASTEPTAIPAIVASPGVSADLANAFLEAESDPAVRPLMEDLLLQRFAVPEPREYDALRTRFETMQSFWRRHRLAETVHPAFSAAFKSP
jgi:ABC-type phosphate/phosphonate transport system substrate-binding protein